MDDQPNLRQFIDEMSSFDEEAAAKPVAASSSTLPPVGEVVDIAGSGSRIRMKGSNLMSLQSHSDPAVAMSGQVGSQVKMIVDNAWLIANVRTMSADDNGGISAHVDFRGGSGSSCPSCRGFLRRGSRRGR